MSVINILSMLNIGPYFIPLNLLANKPPKRGKKIKLRYIYFNYNILYNET